MFLKDNTLVWFIHLLKLVLSSCLEMKEELVKLTKYSGLDKENIISFTFVYSKLLTFLIMPLFYVVIHLFVKYIGHARIGLLVSVENFGGGPKPSIQLINTILL